MICSGLTAHLLRVAATSRSCSQRFTVKLWLPQMLPNFGYGCQIMPTDVKKRGLPQMSANRPNIGSTGKALFNVYWAPASFLLDPQFGPYTANSSPLYPNGLWKSIWSVFKAHSSPSQPNTFEIGFAQFHNSEFGDRLYGPGHRCMSHCSCSWIEMLIVDKLQRLSWHH